MDKVNLVLTIVGLIISAAGLIISIIVFYRTKRITEILELKNDIQEYNDNREYYVNVFDAFIKILDSDDLESTSAISDLFTALNSLLNYSNVFDKKTREKLTKIIEELKADFIEGNTDIDKKKVVDYITILKSQCLRRREFYK
jgi:hypothetical protein